MRISLCLVSPCGFLFRSSYDCRWQTNIHCSLDCIRYPSCWFRSSSSSSKPEYVFDAFLVETFHASKCLLHSFLGLRQIKEKRMHPNLTLMSSSDIRSRFLTVLPWFELSCISRSITGRTSCQVQSLQVLSHTTLLSFEEISLFLTLILSFQDLILSSRLSSREERFKKFLISSERDAWQRYGIICNREMRITGSFDLSCLSHVCLASNLKFVSSNTSRSTTSVIKEKIQGDVWCY
jgi:hypothetical protein